MLMRRAADTRGPERRTKGDPNGRPEGDARRGQAVGRADPSAGPRGREYDSDEHHGPRFWLADDARRERIEELGWTVIVVDRFDLRPSSTRLKEKLEQLSPPRFVGVVPQKRAGERPAHPDSGRNSVAGAVTAGLD